MPVEHKPIDEEAEPGPGIRLSIDPELVSTSLARVLRRRCFVRVTMLDALEPADGEDASSLDLSAVAGLGADLVLQCTVDNDSLVHTELNEKFWLNLPLFLVGGPLSYFVDDRSYRGHARIRASVHDIHPILAGRATLQDGRSEYLYAEGGFSDTTLDFIDRAGSDLRSYGLSVVVPVGLLAKRGARVEEAVARRVADELAEALADAILVRTDALSGSGRVCDFFLAPGVHLERDEHGGTLSGRVLVRRGSPMKLAWCRASLGGQLVTVRFPALDDPPGSGSRYQEYAFEMQLKGEASFAHLEIASGGRDPQMRSYTIPGS